MLVYFTEQLNNQNYTIELTGTDLEDVTSLFMYARGNELDLSSANTDYVVTAGNTIQFTIGYNHISALAGAQTDGYVSTSLVLNGHNTGLTLRFYLDSNNGAPAVATFNE